MRIGKNILLLGIGEGVHVLEHMKDRPIEGVTMISAHHDPEVLDAVATPMKLPLSKRSPEMHQPFINKLVEYADMIVIVTGYDEHTDFAYQVAKTFREHKKPSIGILTPDLEQDMTALDQKKHRKVGSKIDCLLGVEKETVDALKRFSSRRMKWTIRKHTASLIRSATTGGDRALSQGTGYYDTREHLTVRVSDALSSTNGEFKRRNRGCAGRMDLFRFV